MSERAFAASDLTAMKIIDIRGILNMEPVRGGTDEWYWATDYIHGDLYEAEELFRDGHPVKSNRLYLIHYPDGAVYEPVPPVDGQYLGYPVYDDGGGIVAGKAGDEILGPGFFRAGVFHKVQDFRDCGEKYTRTEKARGKGRCHSKNFGCAAS